MDFDKLYKFVRIMVDCDEDSEDLPSLPDTEQSGVIIHHKAREFVSAFLLHLTQKIGDPKSNLTRTERFIINSNLDDYYNSIINADKQRSLDFCIDDVPKSSKEENFKSASRSIDLGITNFRSYQWLHADLHPTRWSNSAEYDDALLLVSTARKMFKKKSWLRELICYLVNGYRINAVPPTSLSFTLDLPCGPHTYENLHGQIEGCRACNTIRNRRVITPTTKQLMLFTLHHIPGFYHDGAAFGQMFDSLALPTMKN
jgi:hypothetical protein